MSTYPLKISTPDGDLFSGAVYALYLRGAEGDLAILPGHISFITTVKPGVCRVQFEDGSEKSGTCNGGILSVTSEATTLLASSFNWNE